MRMAWVKRIRDQRRRNRRSDWRTGPKEGLQRRKEKSGGGGNHTGNWPKKWEERAEGCEEEAAVPASKAGLTYQSPHMLWLLYTSESSSSTFLRPSVIQLFHHKSTATCLTTASLHLSRPLITPLLATRVRPCGMCVWLWAFL